MNKIDPDQPAFPIFLQNGLSNDSHVDTGITLRAYLAAKILAGMLANPVYHNPNEKHKMISVPAAVEGALTYADKLIEQINKNK